MLRGAKGGEKERQNDVVNERLIQYFLKRRDKNQQLKGGRPILVLRDYSHLPLLPLSVQSVNKLFT